MIEQLFGSKTRVKLLKLFYTNPNRSFYVREITRKIDEQINSVRRELSNLLSIGIISSETNNNRLYYEVNQNYEYHKPLGTIFGRSTTNDTKTQNTDSHADPLKELGNITLALYTGHFTRDNTAGVDILIVGNVNQTKLNNYITHLEAEEDKELSYALMSVKEFEYRKQIHDRFIVTVLASKKQIFVDKNKLFETDKV